MKQKILLLFAVLAMAINASAYDFEVDGIYYNYLSQEDLTCEVTYKDGNYKSYSGDAVIPSTVTYSGKTLSVTAIGERAFYECSSLTSIVIPNSVTAIGDFAYCDCSSLTSVTIPNSVTEIGGFAFSGCSSLTSIEIPDYVTSIGCYAFSGCSNLPVVNNLRYADTYLIESVDKTQSTYTIKEGTKWIGDDAFRNCSSLTSMEISNPVTSIGNYAFSGCSNLTSVTIPNSVTSIGNYAFSGCDLKEITSLAVMPPNIECYTFNDYLYINCVLKVPNKSVKAYKAEYFWKKFNISGLYRSHYAVISTTEGLATLWLEYDAKIPANVEVYYASEYNDSKVKMKNITDDILRRETGVIVKGTAGTYTFEEADTEGVELEDNLLVGSATEKTFNDAGYKYFKLTYDSEGNNLGFYLANADGTIVGKPHKAYLKLSTGGAGAPAHGIGIDWGYEGTTEIESVVDSDTENCTLYNLQGMPVKNDYKGIVIKNGRKILN